MAYLKPPGFVRHVFNPLAMKFGISGTWTLAVRGRTSGEEQTIPVIPIERDGVKYVVSTRGESEWVRNARATGAVELRRKGASTRYAVREVPVEERAPIIDQYRAVAGKTVAAYWKQLPDPADHPTFALTPAG
ncbi:MAG: nitroreductase/quinone reductase family protein [Acidimicrobiia bacterium]|jgi:deazaflavin-dependent oxidoreductase (nitroreductase family)